MERLGQRALFADHVRTWREETYERRTGRPVMCWGSDVGRRGPVNGHQGRRPKAAKERNRGDQGTRRISVRYGELVGTVAGAWARRCWQGRGGKRRTPKLKPGRMPRGVRLRSNRADLEPRRSDFAEPRRCQPLTSSLNTLQ